MVFNSLVSAADKYLDSVQLWHLHNFPYSEKVRQSITRQVPMIKFEKEGEIADCYRELAKKVEALEFERAKGGMQFFLKQAITGNR